MRNIYLFIVTLFCLNLHLLARDTKSIGYAVQKVPGEDLLIARDKSAVNHLADKVPGFTISKTNGGAGSSLRILLHGIHSFTNNNQVLIGINGTIQNEHNLLNL